MDKNRQGLTHYEHAHKNKVTNCSAHDLTFGGYCLNCGFMPLEEELLRKKKKALIKKLK